MFDQLQQRPERPETFFDPSADAGPGVFERGLEQLGRTNRMLGGAIATVAKAPLDPLINPEPYRAVLQNAERQSRLVDNAFASSLAQEEAYDRRIATIKAATGADLENPLRGGYNVEARQRMREARRAGGEFDPGGIPAEQSRIFNERLDELRQKHPDQVDAFTGDIAAEARQLAHEAETAPYPEGVNPAAGLVFGFAGGLWGQMRDPLFTGSLFAGPVGATGKYALTRMANAGLRQGLYNMGLSAIEQPAVQAWRAEIGVKSGIVPAIENVGMAFLFGAIPGAAFRGVHEMAAAKPAIERVLAGRPEPGDAESVAGVIERAHLAQREALQEPPVQGEAPVEARALRMGEEMAAADRATEVTAEQEKLSGVAIKIGDAVYQAPNHFLALQKAAKETNKDLMDIFGLANDGHVVDGFLTSTGRFVGRAEADAIAEKAHQKVALEPGQPKASEGLGANELNLTEPALGPPLHDDMAAAALKRADDPVNQPAPEAVEMLARAQPRESPVQRQIGDGVFVEGNTAFVEGAPRESYVRDIGESAVPLPTTDELSKALATLRDADRKYSNAVGLTDAEHNKLRVLNRRIDQEGGAIADEAIKEKNAIADRVKDKDIYNLDIADEGELRQLLTEFGSLERSGAETAAEHEDGIARVLKRYVGQVIDGDPFAKAVFRKAFDEARKAGFDTKLLGNETMRRYLGDLSPSDQAFMRREFENFLRPKIEAPERAPMPPSIAARLAEERPQTLADAQMVVTHALEEDANRFTVASLRDDLGRPVYQAPNLQEKPAGSVEPAPLPRGDKLGMIPTIDDSGAVKLVTPGTLAKAGERETNAAALVRECK